MTFRKAKQKHPALSQESSLKELKQQLDKDIFRPTLQSSLTHDQKSKIIRSHTFFKEKYLVSGELDKLKARLVAGGHMVDHDDLGDIYSPTGKHESLMLLFGLASQLGWSLTVMDIPGAYLNTRLPVSEQVPMIIGKEETETLLLLRPDWKPFVRKDGSMLVIVVGGLYGLPQASKLWYEHLKSTLESLGYRPTEMDSSC